MKKLFCALCSAALCLSLAACGGSGAGAPAPFDPEADAKTLLETPGVFANPLEEIDQATACALYGIDEATVENCKVYVGNAGVSLEELAVFALTDDTAAEDALAFLQYRVEDQKEAAAGYAGYLQEELSKLDGAIVQQRGSSVLLVIAANYGPVNTFLGG